MKMEHTDTVEDAIDVDWGISSDTHTGEGLGITLALSILWAFQLTSFTYTSTVKSLY